MDYFTEQKLNIYQPLIYAVIMMMGMFLGFKVYQTTYGHSAPISANFDNKNASLSQINDVLQFVEQHYVDTINSSKLVDDAISEILENLDPHSTYIPPKDMQQVEESLQGNFEGIGIEFFILNDTITVVTPISGGPSEAIGIQSGDRIVEIEDSIVAGIGLSNKDVIDRLRGEKGTLVKVGISRIGLEKVLDFNIKRDKIPLYSVDVGYMLDEEIGYIKINRFSQTTYREFTEKLIQLKESGMKDLVLDLRQNPGGYLTAATNIIDELLSDRRLIVYTEGRTHKRNDYKARRKGMFEQGDLVVLIDQGSASASEILAGAVQDWDRGTILGRRSFGKGLVQDQYQLKNGGLLRLTIARYYTPTGRSIQKHYELGENDDYEKELAQRYDNGEYMNEDSIKSNDEEIFQTSAGRTVYGGGGITPDIFIPLDTSINDEYAIKALSLIPKFSYDYFGKNKLELDNFKSFNDFNNTFSINSKIFSNFKDYLKKEKVNIDKEQLTAHGEIFKTRIKAYIARQIWSNEGFYPILHQMDDEVNKAYRLIKDDQLITDRLSIR